MRTVTKAVLGVIAASVMVGAGYYAGVAGQRSQPKPPDSTELGAIRVLVSDRELLRAAAVCGSSEQRKVRRDLADQLTTKIAAMTTHPIGAEEATTTAAHVRAMFAQPGTTCRVIETVLQEQWADIERTLRW